MWSRPHRPCNRRATLLALLLPTVLAGCDSEQSAWEIAEATATFSAYRRYVADHPEGSHIDVAQRRIDSLLFAVASRVNTVYAYSHFLERVPGTRYRNQVRRAIQNLRSSWPAALAEVDTIAVEFHTSFPEGYEFPEKRIFSQIRGIYRGTTLTAVTADLQEAGGRLVITIRGEPLKASYTPGGTRYSGAIVSGEIALIANGQRVATDSIYQRMTPPDIILGDKRRNPEDAPFSIVYDDLVLKIFRQLYTTCNLPPSPKAEIHVEGGRIKLVDDGRVFADLYTDQVKVFSGIDGELLRVLEAPEGRLAAAAGSVYIAVGGGDVRGLDSRTGTVLWETVTLHPAAATGVLDASNGSVYLITHVERLVALDLLTGATKWSVPIDDDSRRRTWVTADGQTVFFATQSRVHAVDAEDGTMAWTFDNPTDEGRLTITDDVVYANEGDTLRAIIAEQGETKWSVETPLYGLSEPVVSNGIVLAGTSDGAYAVNRATGHVLWTVDAMRYAQGTHHGREGQLVVGGNTTYIIMEARDTETLFALDAKSGLVKWTFWTEEARGTDLDLIAPSGVVFYSDHWAYTFDPPQ